MELVTVICGKCIYNASMCFAEFSLILAGC